MLSRQTFDSASGELQYGKYKHSSSYPIDPRFGGTGANNSGANAQIVVANTVTFAGNYATTITSTAATSITLPTSGTLSTKVVPTTVALTTSGAAVIPFNGSFTKAGNIVTLVAPGIQNQTFLADTILFTIPAPWVPTATFTAVIAGEDNAVFLPLYLNVGTDGAVFMGPSINSGTLLPGAFTAGTTNAGWMPFSLTYIC